MFTRIAPEKRAAVSEPSGVKPLSFKAFFHFFGRFFELPERFSKSLTKLREFLRPNGN
jgi:hypothetical protein